MSGAGEQVTGRGALDDDLVDAEVRDRERGDGPPIAVTGPIGAVAGGELAAELGVELVLGRSCESPPR